jgi:hypothetical protein
VDVINVCVYTAIKLFLSFYSSEPLEGERLHPHKFPQPRKTICLGHQYLPPWKQGRRKQREPRKPGARKSFQLLNLFLQLLNSFFLAVGSFVYFLNNIHPRDINKSFVMGKLFLKIPVPTSKEPFSGHCEAEFL